MKILIVMGGGFDTYGPSRHLYDSLIEDILEAKHEVHLIESHSSGTDPDIPNKFLKYKTFTYEVVNSKVVQKKQFVRRYLNDLKYVFDCKKPLKRAKNKFDIVLVQSMVSAPFMIPLVKKQTKSFVVWNIQDMFPGASIANGVLKNKLLQRIFFKLHKKAYRKADHITVISSDMKKKVIEQGCSSDNITVISDWFDDRTVKQIPWNDNLFVKEQKMSDKKFYVQYAGTMGFNFDYKLVLETAKLLLSYKDIVFQMIGFGSQYDVFKKAAKDLNLINIQFLPIQQQNMVAHVYSACSVCLIPLPEGVIGNSVPSKIGLLMACKKPVISTSDLGSDYLKMINDNKIGFGFGTNEYKKVADAIVMMSKNSSLCVEYGMNGYKYGHNIFSRTYNTGLYIKLFNSIYNKLRQKNNE